MTDETPWYMRGTSLSADDLGNDEAHKRYADGLADSASEAADALSDHLRDAEKRGVDIPVTERLAMGYAANARAAAREVGR
ncbi:hypothetical protein [Streptomyces sp. WMMB303]|uniref:hypothetical protein n=1 Tax=Streptomyces sp. WMMB303 TaxID=3034154 RepID=UPI0023EB9CF6|nr:hypothetical protein [Streptomyces sp. WMMB303]MDF4250091.1 hypothetical protein [Streptomyces sp. WMMB303]